MILDGLYLFLYYINHFKYRGTTSALDGNFGELKYKFEGGWIPCLWAANEKKCIDGRQLSKSQLLDKNGSEKDENEVGSKLDKCFSIVSDEHAITYCKHVITLIIINPFFHLIWHFKFRECSSSSI